MRLAKKLCSKYAELKRPGVSTTRFDSSSATGESDSSAERSRFG